MRRSASRRIFRRVVALALVLPLGLSAVPASATETPAQGPAEAVTTTTLPVDFVIETVMDVGGAFSANAMAFLPEESLVAVADNRGMVSLFGEDGTAHGRILDISRRVNTYSDRGLTGIAFHPDFSSGAPEDRLLYLWYVWDPPRLEQDSPGRRISRLSTVQLTPRNRRLADGSVVASYRARANTERVLLGAADMANPLKPTRADVRRLMGDDPDCTALGSCFPFCLNDGDPANDADCVPIQTCTNPDGTYITDCIGADDPLHNTGTLRFGRDGLLYAGHGDGSSAIGADPRAVRTLDPNSLNGKILRLNPRNGRGVSRNPWWTGDARDNASRVYSAGLRNPFRFAVHPVRTDVMLGDVGFSLWEEINTGEGTTHGWPCYEGGHAINLVQVNYQSMPACEALYDDVAAGLTTVTPSVHAFAHPVDADGNPGGGAAIGGDWYRGQEWPELYDEAYFFTDFESGTLRFLPAMHHRSGRVIGNTSEAQEFATGLGLVVDTQLGPDGNLWLLEIGNLSGTEPVFNGVIKRIRFVGDDPNRAPVLSLPGPQASGLGGDVRLQVLASDPDQKPVTFTVAAGNPLPPGLEISADGLITGRPTTPGTYQVEVVAGDGQRSSSGIIEWFIDTEFAPEAEILSPTVTDGYAIGDMVAMRGAATDAEDGQLEGDSLRWSVELRHAGHVHPDEQGGTGEVLAPFWITEHGRDWYLVGCLHATDTSGYSDVECIDIRLEESSYVVGTDPPGLTVALDEVPINATTTVGLYRNHHASVSAPLEQRGLTFAGWTVGRGRTQDVVGGTTPSQLIARYVDTLPPANQARGGVARQSSTFSSAVCGSNGAELAIDGSIAGFEEDCTASHTFGDANEWWEVDLGSVMLVEEVRVYNWLHHSLSRLSNGYVMVSPTPFGDRDLAAVLADPAISRQRFGPEIGRPTVFTSGQRGRYVRVQLEGAPGRALVMSEVQVIAAPARPPVAEADAPRRGSAPGDPVHLDASRSVDPDDAGPLTFGWAFTSDTPGATGRFDDPTSATPVLDTAGLSVGVHTAQVTVTDADGAQDTATAEIGIGANPVAQATGLAGPHAISGVITLDASGSRDPEGTVPTIDWDIDGDGEFDDAAGARVDVSALSLGYGRWPVVARATSGLTHLSGTAEVTIWVARPPIAILTGTSDVVERGEAAELSAQASRDPEGGALTYAWDLDNDGVFDDSAQRSPVLDTTNLAAGDHPIALRVTSPVTDQVGIDREVLRIVAGSPDSITPSSPGPPSPPASTPQRNTSITLDADPAEAEVGQAIIVTMTLANPSDASTTVDATLELSDLLVDDLPPACMQQGRRVTCPGIVVPAAGTADLVLTLIGEEVGSLDLSATAVPVDADDPDLSDNSDMQSITIFQVELGAPEPGFTTPATAAIELSRRLYGAADGPAADDRAAATAVVLSRDDAFADSLTGAALTGNAPLLFTGSDQLTSQTLQEIQRVLPAGGQVLVLGGINAIATAVTDDLGAAGFVARRLAGPTRVETAVAIADEVIARHGDALHAGVARADGPADNPTASWADSVAAGGWAARTGQPILLTDTGSLHPATAAWLDDHDLLPVVLGGPAAIAADVAEALGPHLRHSGDNRFATAIAIAEEQWPEPNGYLITAGDHPFGWAYGLASAGLSARTNQPLLLVETSRLPVETDRATCRPDRAPTEVIGGMSVVDRPVRDQLTSLCRQ